MNAIALIKRPVAIHTKERIGDAMDAFVAKMGEEALARLMLPRKVKVTKRIEPEVKLGVLDQRGEIDLRALDDEKEHSAVRVAMIAKHGATIGEISEITRLSKSSVTHWTKRLVEVGAVRVTSEPHMGVSVYVISAEEGGPDAARRMTSKAERKKNGGHVRAVSRSPAYRGIMNALMDAKGPMPRKAVVQATGLEEMQVDYSLKYLRTCGLIERKNSRYSLSEEGRAVAKKACNIAPPRQRVRAAVLVAERTTGAIADRADVDRNTARRALLEMVDEGTVEMRMEHAGKRQRMWWKLKEASE